MNKWEFGNPHNGPSGKCKITIRNWISLKIAQVSKKKSYYKISRRVLKRYSGGRRNTDEGRSHGSVADLPAVKKEMNRNYFQSERDGGRERGRGGESAIESNATTASDIQGKHNLCQRLRESLKLWPGELACRR